MPLPGFYDGQKETLMDSSSDRLEVFSQEYDNGSVSAGFVEDSPPLMTYLKLVRGGEVVELLLRPDELAAVALCANSVLWSTLVAAHIEGDTPDDGVAPDFDSGGDVQP